jgi:hypothetical protein
MIMTTRPTHRIYAVKETNGKSSEAKKFWAQIGAAWAHQDAKGMTLKFDLWPMQRQEIVLREITEKDSA